MAKGNSGLSQAQRDVARSVAPSQSKKRPLDGASEPTQTPPKRLTRAGTRRLAAEKEKTQQTTETLHESEPATASQSATSPVHVPDSIYSESHLKSIDSFVSGWLDSIGPGRGGRDGPDSAPKYPDHDNATPRPLSRLNSTHDTSQAQVLPAEVPAGSYPFRSGGIDGSIEPPHSFSSDQSSGMSLVDNPRYRTVNLTDNRVFIRDYGEHLPRPVAELVDRVGTERHSSGQPLKDLMADPAFCTLYLGATEPEIEAFYKGRVFPNTAVRDVLKRVDRQPVAVHAVPNTAGPGSRISTPKPDLLYGYNCSQPFTAAQRHQVNRMADEIIANAHEMMCPFLAVEMKGETPGQAAKVLSSTNQCAGGSAACVNIAERLNSRLRDCGNDRVQPINTAAFSISMTGASANLYVTWKHNKGDYYMTLVDSFSLQIPRQFFAFRNCVLNIVEWGEGDRLEGIRDLLNVFQGIDPVESAPPPPTESSPATDSDKGS